MKQNQDDVLEFTNKTIDKAIAECLAYDMNARRFEVDENGQIIKVNF